VSLFLSPKYYSTEGNTITHVANYIFTTIIAFAGQARAQSPHPLHNIGSGIGISKGASCLSNLRGHAAAAAQIPFSHISGWHLSN
jgi:hypothetical protein